MDCAYFRDYMKTLSKLVDKYYSLRNCGSGGPLHILLDDDNYDIDSIHFCMNYCFECLQMDCEDYDKEVYILGIMICNEYAKMYLAERAMFVAYKNGAKIKCDIPDSFECKGCRILDELYEDMKEKEKNS